MLGLGLGLPLTPLMGAISELTRLLKLDLNFLTGALDPRVTFTRASSATYFASTGRLATASNDAPRFDYDPATLSARGLLIEESRTNLLRHSRDMTQAAWSKIDVTPTRNQVGIDGTANSACLITEGSAGTALCSQDGSVVTAGSTITVSNVLKRGNTDWMRVGAFGGGFANGASGWFNLATGAKGTVVAVGAATAATSTIQNLGGGYYRCTVTCLPNGAYTVPKGYFLSASADGSATRVPNATYIVDCAQLEVGAFATSIITTGAATATRAADISPMTGTNFSSWFNASAGTFVVEYSVPQSSSTNAFLIAASVGGTASNRHQMIARLGGGAASEAATVSGGAAAADKSSPQGAAGTTSKSAYAFAVNDFALSVNGATALTDTSGALPVGTVDQMRIGSDWSGAFQINSHIRRITYYPVRLSNAQLQALTA